MPVERRRQGARDLAESNLRSAETVPVLRRYKVNDSTVEKLGELLNQIRGAKVQVTVDGQSADGTILGLEKKIASQVSSR